MPNGITTRKFTPHSLDAKHHHELTDDAPQRPWLRFLGAVGGWIPWPLRLRSGPPWKAWRNRSGSGTDAPAQRNGPKLEAKTKRR